MNTSSGTVHFSRAVSLWIAAVTLFVAGPVLAADAPSARVLIVVGPSTHPPGSHEVAAGGRLLKSVVESATNVPDMKVDLFNEWPKDPAVRASASTIVFLGDWFPPVKLPDPKSNLADLSAMMDRGCGIVCLHFANGLGPADVPDDGDHPLLRWTGGYFASKTKHHQSVPRIMDATITPADTPHPVLRGWKTFPIHDEPYYNNYFGPNGMAPGVTALATAMLPPEAPKKEIVAWCIERKDGGRGVGIVMPHFYKNWKEEDLRRFIMNGIVWTAKLEVPAEGVQTPSPDLAAFNPVSIEPKPMPKTKPATAK